MLRFLLAEYAVRVARPFPLSRQVFARYHTPMWKVLLVFQGAVVGVLALVMLVAGVP